MKKRREKEIKILQSQLTRLVLRDFIELEKIKLLSINNQHMEYISICQPNTTFMLGPKRFSNECKWQTANFAKRYKIVKQTEVQ